MSIEPNLESILRQTLEDQRFSRSEKKALQQFAGDWSDSRSRILAQSMAFRIASEELIDPHSKAILEWLEGVIKVVHQGADDESAPTSEVLFSPIDDCAGRIQGLLKVAQKSIDICVFTITDNRITEQILSAHRRGLRVRVLTDNDKANDLGSDVDLLEKSGVPVRRDRSEYHMHHKFALFDASKLLTGSFNWTVSAGRENEENIVICDDPGLIQRFSGEFNRLWQAFA